MKVALYARNSKPPQGWKPTVPGEEPPGSWRQQLQQLRAWAQREGHVVVLEGYDAQVSGKDPNRPGWQSIMAAVRGHQVQAVAAVKLDRVMRSAGHFHETVQEFEKATADLFFVDQGLSLGKRNPMTKAMLGFLAIMAELERDWARERQEAVMRVGEDGRVYGPRSSKPAGRPAEFGDGHKFRIRDGRKEHNRARCPACRGENGGREPSLLTGGETNPLGERNGFPTPRGGD